MNPRSVSQSPCSTPSIINGVNIWVKKESVFLRPKEERRRGGIRVEQHIAILLFIISLIINWQVWHQGGTDDSQQIVARLSDVRWKFQTHNSHHLLIWHTSGQKFLSHLLLSVLFLFTTFQRRKKCRRKVSREGGTLGKWKKWVYFRSRTRCEGLIFNVNVFSTDHISLRSTLPTGPSLFSLLIYKKSVCPWKDTLIRLSKRKSLRSFRWSPTFK